MTEFEKLTSEEKRKMELYRARHGSYDSFLGSGIGILDEKDCPKSLELSDENVRTEAHVNQGMTSLHFHQELEQASNNFLSRLGILMWLCK